ncbi:MAG: ATP synthase F0 subunit C [Bdellovibrionales bacterium]|nr:ATP synthase F0 subunit C [Bdellovibrionales bacterium]
MNLKQILTCTAATVLGAATPALAADGAAAASVAGFDGISAGIAIGLAAVGGALGQGRTCSAALEGIGRNPGAAGQLQTPMIIGLVLIESLVIYALVISLKLAGFF